MIAAGVVVQWNFPFFLACAKVAPAIAAGCTMILKPAEQTPLSSIYLGSLLREVRNGLVFIAFRQKSSHGLITRFRLDCGTGTSVVRREQYALSVLYLCFNRFVSLLCVYCLLCLPCAW